LLLHGALLSGGNFGWPSMLAR